MNAIIEKRVWWTGLLRPRPTDSTYPWYVLTESEEYYRVALRAPGARSSIQSWCEKNCMHAFDVGRTEAVRFADEGDAILFKIAFAKGGI